jgi:ATP-dependent Clp protease ATP-binding subunit ClpB
MTSNLGSHLIQEEINKNGGALSTEQSEALYGRISALLKQTIRPEFLNRIDEMIMFSPLSSDEIKQIVRLQINSVKKMLKDSDVELDVTDEAVARIAQEGYDPEFGARPVKRVIQRCVLNELSKQLIADKVDRTKPIVVDVKNGELEFRN